MPKQTEGKLFASTIYKTLAYNGLDLHQLAKLKRSAYAKDSLNLVCKGF